MSPNCRVLVMANALVGDTKYSTYKYSGLEWLGSIPNHWEVKALKHGAAIVLGKMLCPENKGGYFLRPYLKSKNIQWLNAETSSVDEMWFSKEEMELYRLKKADLVLSEGGEVGKTCYWNEELPECYIQNSAHRVRFFKGHNPRYFLYQFFSAGNIGHFDSIVNRVSIAHLTREKLANTNFAFPTEQEQADIAHFLDQQSVKIDAVIQIKERQIERLKERKQILIQQAVTRGLDPHAPMQASGIEWIGEIPAHWQTRRFKYLFSQSQLPVRPDDGVVTSYRDGQVTLRSNRRLSGYTEAILEGGYQGVRKGQLVLNSMDAFEGAIGVSESDGKCTPEYVVCDALSDEYLPEYFAYLLREMALARYIQVICNAVRQRAVRIRFNNLASRFMVVPPIEEQRAIVAHIKAETEKQDAAVALLEQQISKLKEYKATLINSAVTGKIKVPGVVEPATQDMEVA